MKNYMLTGVVALLLALLIPACQPEEPINVPFEETLALTELDKDPNLAKLLTDFTGQSLNGRTASSEMPFGTLDYSNIVSRVASEGQPKPNYTIKLIPPDSVKNTREYLVLIGDEEGYWGYIIQYKASTDNIHTLFDQNKFTGTAHILNFNRVVQSVNYFENGVDLGSEAGTDNGRSEASFINCTCIWGFGTPDLKHGDGTGAAPIDKSNIVCDCDEPSVFDGRDAGGLGGRRTYLPGQPVGDNPFGGSSGGGSGGSGRTLNDGIEEPGDNIGTKSNNLPIDIAAINEDSEFIAMLQQDPDIWDCYNEMLQAGAYDIIRGAHDIKKTFTTVALVQEAMRTACGEGVTDPDDIHLLLDGLGFVPVIGEGFDFINGLLYIKEGDFYNAGFSFIAIVPVVGDAAGKGTKYVLKAIKVSDEAFDAAKQVITIIKSVPAGVRKELASRLLKLDLRLRVKLAAEVIARPELLDRIINNPIVVESWKFTTDVIDRLKRNQRTLYELDGTGDYRTVRGHHPTAKKAFEGDAQYNYNDAFSVSANKLDEITGIKGVHSKITGQQKTLYSAWKRNNPNKKLTLDDMADIEIQAMTEAGIPESVARGWVIEAIEDLQAQGVTEITNIPWNGLN